MARLLSLCLAVSLCLGGVARSQNADAAAMVKQGQKLLDEGNLDAAVGQFRAAVAADPQRYDAQDGLGRALDLTGNYQEARQHLERAIALAPDDSKNQALATMAVSLAFEGRAEDAARYYRRAFDAQMQAKDPAAAAATANAMARVYLEAGMLDKAEQWYRTGYETSKRLSHRPASQARLWELRWQHALGRIAARRHRRAAALHHAATVKRLVDQGGNENQRPAYPYLLGYIDYHTRHYREAIAALKRGDENDLFVLGLTAQSYRRLGDRAHAREYFERVMASTAHNLPAAFMRPVAREYLK